jgi:hypothetical protein
MEDSTSRLTSRWLVQVTDHDFDLSHWERSLKPPFDPFCERIPNGGQSVFVLRSQSFASARVADEVRARALPLIEQLNGALNVVAGAEPLSFQSVVKTDDKGSLSFSVYMEDQIHVRSEVVAVAEVRDANGNLVPPPTPEPSMAQRWIEASETNDEIADLLIFAGRTDSWFDIYKAIELAERLSGSKDKLHKLLGASGAEYKRMRETANFYRHARGYRPNVLTTLPQAKTLLSLVVRTVLAHYGGPPPAHR